MTYKFRIWDKVMNRMFYTSELANGDMIAIGIDGKLMLSDDDTYKVTDFELMQYTGQKAMHRKKLYEGDICIKQSGLQKYYYVIRRNINGFQCITYAKPEEKWIMGTAHRANQGHFYAPELEIVGNIYENPDLLTWERL